MIPRLYVLQLNHRILFADDSKLHREVDQPGGENLLQNDLECLLKWSQDWSMESNKAKRKVQHISKKESPSTNRYYTLDGRQLERVSTITDTGMTVSNDMHMSWPRHIYVTVAKANRTLGLLKRMYSLQYSSKGKLLYCALVRWDLDYNSSLRSPYTVKHRAFLENVQRRATKFILN
ncbi:uncharacterized protein [Montipora capricornis]|uniref:uncharacterized protein n=1 Tax=Montipora capricornis TaxID=246305 RepID=UPI0035F1F3D0